MRLDPSKIQAIELQNLIGPWALASGVSLFLPNCSWESPNRALASIMQHLFSGALVGECNILCTKDVFDFGLPGSKMHYTQSMLRALIDQDTSDSRASHGIVMGCNPGEKSTLAQLSAETFLGREPGEQATLSPSTFEFLKARGLERNQSKAKATAVLSTRATSNVGTANLEASTPGPV
ncbi:uncharacterized protein BDCG_00398 [Blastomyces dermatitidis ER-3]|uniref:Uncharacterized protein n=1 Tax=Ajellomyces dermatitidis (strain ER-3 / ATCC MYA-2586) TaxID=559297 RepID=A0ABP2ELV7_AJEDR|nr:uncharacterized protein BDCG_00398 [Blastomyces dermatitidis ER-3]EEQ83593.2 hypothetical protein BDCG_00398 [Blastomyces dermatitidis ER-3]